MKRGELPTFTPLPIVFVQTEGTEFVLDGSPFFAQGVNSYFVGFCSEAASRQTLLGAKAMGANTVRAWAFLSVHERLSEQAAFQYLLNGAIAPDDGPNGLERLDRLIWLAEELELRLILPFVNYWTDFGGMPLYLRWLGLGPDVKGFYQHPRARNAYQSWVEHLLTRRNTCTGRIYADEPAVLAWELANEPRCPGRRGREILLEWIDVMSRFVKVLAPRHLVCAGDEGFFRWRSFSHLYNGGYGVDCEAILELDAIDFGTYHLYPEGWGQSNPGLFAKRWITEHIEAGRRAGKPVLLEEFGLELQDASASSFERRSQEYVRWVVHTRREGGAGALIWMLGSEGSDVAGFRDRFTFSSANQLFSSGELIAD